MSIALTPIQEQLLERLVSPGRYGSAVEGTRCRITVA